jgi:translation initiation factor IF-2
VALSHGLMRPRPPPLGRLPRGRRRRQDRHRQPRGQLPLGTPRPAGPVEEPQDGLACWRAWPAPGRWFEPRPGPGDPRGRGAGAEPARSSPSAAASPPPVRGHPTAPGRRPPGGRVGARPHAPSGRRRREGGQARGARGRGAAPGGPGRVGPGVLPPRRSPLGIAAGTGADPSAGVARGGGHRRRGPSVREPPTRRPGAAYHRGVGPAIAGLQLVTREMGWDRT